MGISGNTTKLERVGGCGPRLPPIIYRVGVCVRPCAAVARARAWGVGLGGHCAAADDGRKMEDVAKGRQDFVEFTDALQQC